MIIISSNYKSVPSNTAYGLALLHLCQRMLGLDKGFAALVFVRREDARRPLCAWSHSASLRLHTHAPNKNALAGDGGTFQLPCSPFDIM